jgi:hypothetical protein
MNNTPAPAPKVNVNAPKPGSSLMGWAIAIGVTVVIALIIYLIVRGVNKCNAKNDEATKKGPGALKCEQGDTGPSPRCGDWVCTKTCAKSYPLNPTYTESPLNKDFCQGMNVFTQKLETIPKVSYPAK